MRRLQFDLIKLNKSTKILSDNNFSRYFTASSAKAFESLFGEKEVERSCSILFQHQKSRIVFCSTHIKIISFFSYTDKV